MEVGVVALRAPAFVGLGRRASGRRRDGNLRRPRGHGGTIRLRPVSGGTVRAARLSGAETSARLHGRSAARASCSGTARARVGAGKMQGRGYPRNRQIERKSEKQDPSC